MASTQFICKKAEQKSELFFREFLESASRFWKTKYAAVLQKDHITMIGGNFWGNNWRPFSFEWSARSSYWCWIFVKVDIDFTIAYKTLFILAHWQSNKLSSYRIESFLDNICTWNRVYNCRCLLGQLIIL